VRDDLEEDGAVLSVVGSSIEGFAQSAFDHAEDRFDLPPLAVAAALGRSAEVGAHLATEAGGGRLGRRPTDGGRDECANAVLVAGVPMHPLGIVAGIRQQRVDRSATTRLTQSLPEVPVVRPRAASRHGRENQMRAAVDQQAGLRKAPIGQVLQAFVAPSASADEVVADVMGLEAAAVEGRQPDAAASKPRGAGDRQRGVEEPVRGVFFSRRSAAF